MSKVPRLSEPEELPHGSESRGTSSAEFKLYSYHLTPGCRVEPYMAKQARRIAVSVITRAAVSIVLLTIALAVAGMLFVSRPTAPSTDEEPAAPRVQVLAIKPVPIRRHWRGFGTARAMDSANVPSEVAAIVEERPIHIQPGVSVNRGELLVKLDDDDFARQVEISQKAIADFDAQIAQLDVEKEAWDDRAALAAEDTAVAQSELNRVEEAFRRSAAKEREVDLARQALTAARRVEVAAREELNKIEPRRARLDALKAQQESQLKLAQQNLQRCVITSPIEGVLQAVDVELGESVTPGQRVARVVSHARIEVPIRLPASARRELRTGDEVTLFATGAGSHTWSATLARIAPEDDEQSRTVTVFAELMQDEDADWPLAPGRFVEGEVVSSIARDLIALPRRALTSERIVIVEGGVARSMPVDVMFHLTEALPGMGLPDREWVVIETDLPAGTYVVLNKAMSITDGTVVEPVPVNGREAEAASAEGSL